MSYMMKSVVALLLCILMVFGSVVSAFAQGNEDGAYTESDVSYFFDNSLGRIFAQAMKQDDPQEADYGILDINIDHEVAYVTVRSIKVCTLAVVIYDEDGSIVSSGTAAIEAQQTSAEVYLSYWEEPLFFYVQALLLDEAENPLCSPFTDVTHTSTYAAFSAKTVNDFEGQTVLNFDERYDENFAVITDSAVFVNASESRNHLVSADNDRGVYVFSDPSEDLQSLGKGSILCYEPLSDDMVLLKAKNVKQAGATLTVTADKSAELTEFFDYIKIELNKDEQNSQKPRVDMREADVGVAFAGFGDPMEGTQTVVAQEEIDDQESYTEELPIFEWANDYARFTVGAEITYNYSIHFDRAWQWPTQIQESMKEYYYIEVSFFIDITGVLEAEASYETEVNLGRVNYITPIGITIGVRLSMVFDVSGKVEIELAELSCNLGTRYEKDVGWKNLSTFPELQFVPSAEAEVEFSIALRVTPNITFLFILGINNSYDFGLKATLFFKKNTENNMHMCNTLCFDGSVSMFSKGTLDAFILFARSDKLQLYDWEHKLHDFHIKRIGNQFKYYLGKCPNYGRKVMFTVNDSTGNPVDGTEIVLNGGFVKGEDGTFINYPPLTDAKGQVEAYYPEGKYSVTAWKYGFKDADLTFNVKDESIDVLITMQQDPDTTEESDPQSWSYYITADGYAILKKVPKNLTHARIPSSVKINGEDYPVKVISYGNKFSYRGGEGIYRSHIEYYGSIGAFSGCANLKSVSIPPTVRFIGGESFSNCVSLEHINIPEGTGVDYEGDARSFTHVLGSTYYYDPIYVYSAFYNCKSLKSINYASCAPGIFRGCSSLQSVTIPENATSIGFDAFYGCSSLQSIHIPSNVTSIGYSAFSGCSSLESIHIPSNVTSIGYKAFSKCTSLTDVTIPSAITVIPHGLFEGCSSLQSITIPPNVTEIENEVFKDCISLNSLAFPKSIKKFGYRVFSGCIGLRSIDLPPSVRTINDGMFSGCSKLQKVGIASEECSIGNNAFLGCTELEEISATIISLGSGAFQSCKKLKSITISATHIYPRTFKNCKALRNINIPSEVTEIGDEAFYGCSSLTNIQLPAKLKKIGPASFSECSSLQSITIPEGVSTIYAGTFCNCTSLKSVMIPKRANAYENQTFRICGAGNTLVHSTASDEGNDTWLLGAFCGCTDLETVSITASDYNSAYSLIVIGDAAFIGCESLKHFDVTTSFLRLGALVFYGCSSLENTDFMSKINSGTYADGTEIKAGLFYGCKNLKTVSIPSGIQTIKEEYSYKINSSTYTERVGAFENCTGLESVSIPTSVTVIENYSFLNCNKLKDVFYEGTYEQWKAISIGKYGNNTLLSANIHCIHTHEYTITEQTTATCGQDGIIQYTCSICGESYQNKTPATNEHTPGAWKVTIPPTETSEGERELYCTTCGKLIQRESVPVVTHEVHDIYVSNATVYYKSSNRYISLYVDADDKAEYTVTYESVDPSVATVDENGHIHALKKGKTDVLVTLIDTQYGNTIAKTCTVTVQYSALQWIILILLFGWLWY